MRLRIAIAIVFLAASVPSRAGSNEWTVTGPFAPGGTVTSLAIDPTNSSVLYAGTYRGGVFKSTDHGETWFPAGAGLRTTFGVDALVIDPTAPEIVYAANGGFVFRSADGGRTWQRSSPDDLWPRTLALDPKSPRVVYAGGSRGLFRSDDSGATWSPVDSGLGSPHVLRIAIDPLTPSTVYVAAYTGLFKTVDAGRSWMVLAPELFPYPDGAVNVVTHPLVPSLVYAGGPRSLFRSYDGGASWTLVRSVSGDDFFYAVAVTQSTVFVGTYRGYLFRSGDAGASWTESRPVSTGWVSPLLGDPTNPSTVFSGAPGLGVRKSGDGGDSWRSTTSEFQHVWVSAVRIDPVTPSTVYAAASHVEWASTPGGVFKSIDGARSWFPASEGLADWRVIELLIDPTTPSMLYAGTEGGVFRSADAGRSWKRTGGDFGRVWSLAIDPRPPSTLYAGTGTAVYKSTDSGETWRVVLPAVANKVAVDPVYPSIVYAGSDGAVFKSHDRGETWSRFATGLPSNFRVTDVVIAALSPTRLLAGGYYVGALPGGTVPGGSFFSSRDGGASWKRIESYEGSGMSAIVPDPVRAGTYYASLLRFGVVMTTDFGINWSRLTRKGLDTDLDDLVVASASPLTLYAGGYGGVFQITLKSEPVPAITSQPPFAASSD